MLDLRRLDGHAFIPQKSKEYQPLVGEKEMDRKNSDAVLDMIRAATKSSRSVDAAIAGALGLELINPFTSRPDLVEEVDNEWVVVTDGDWPPLPSYTASSDVAAKTASQMLGGVLITSEQVGRRSFRTVIRWPGSRRRYVGGVWPTRPLSIIGAGFEVLNGKE